MADVIDGLFIWHDEKQKLVKLKHGIEFSAVKGLFKTGIRQPAKTVDGQTRYMMIGEPDPPVAKVGGGDNIWKVIFAAHLCDDGKKRIRLISAHDANSVERAAYLAHKAQNQGPKP